MTNETKIGTYRGIRSASIAFTPDDLPPAHIKRWVSRRKAEIVTAVDGGLLTRQDACDRYGISREELAQWERGFKAYGLAGLRATRPTGRSIARKDDHGDAQLVEMPAISSSQIR